MPRLALLVVVVAALAESGHVQLLLQLGGSCRVPPSRAASSRPSFPPVWIIVPSAHLASLSPVRSVGRHGHDVHGALVRQRHFREERFHASSPASEQAGPIVSRLCFFSSSSIRPPVHHNTNCQNLGAGDLGGPRAVLPSGVCRAPRPLRAAQEVE